MPDNHAASSPTRTPTQKKTQLWTRIAAIIFLIAIALLKPKFEAWLEHNSTTNESANADVAAAAESGSSIDDSADSTDIRILAGVNVPDAIGDANSDSELIFDRDREPQATKTPPKTSSPPSKTQSKKTGTSAKASGNDSRRNPGSRNSNNTTKKPDSKPPPGKLTLVKGTRDRFRSTAGLMYVPGSRDGHRLKHVLKHAKDDTSKPVHGVFKGDRDQILAWIDIAYEKGRKGGKGVNKSKQYDRDVYIVDMGKNIGFMGGQVGERKNHPPCRYLQLVLEDNEVITAYPNNRPR